MLLKQHVHVCIAQWACSGARSSSEPDVCKPECPTPNTLLHLLMQRFVAGKHTTARDVVATLCRQSLGGPAIGLAFALCFLLLAQLPTTWLEPLALGSASLLAAFASFFVAKDVLGTSGILATVTLGMALALSSRKLLRPGDWALLEHVW